MRLAVISDIHDNLWNLQAVIGHLNQPEVRPDAVLCCGDLCSPFVIDVLRQLEAPVHIVFGNNDADLFRITKKSDPNHVIVHGEFFEAEFAGRRVAMNHFDYLARPMAQSGLYDLVCFGHNHRISRERFGRTLCLNPGPVMGVAFGAKGWEEVDPTFLICDLGGGAETEIQVETLRVGEGRRVETVSGY